MPNYRRHDAHDWAREHLVGVANVVIPTMTSDFKGLNEAPPCDTTSTQCIAHGFVGTLAVSEVAMSLDEYGSCSTSWFPRPRVG